MSYVSCETIEIGEDARIREQVYVGGPQLPESRFALGSRTIILQLTSINPTKPVIIGDDTGIGGHCLIFTHGVWLSGLEGYPVTYEPVTLGRSVWLPWRVFVMPGSTIGDGSVIGANSLVAGAIPPYSLAVGTPAKVVRSAPDFPRKLSDADRSAMIHSMVAEFDRYAADDGITVATDGSVRAYNLRGRAWRLHWVRDGDGASAPAAGDTVLAERPMSEEVLARYRAAGGHWLDLRAQPRSRGGAALTEERALVPGRHRT